MSGAFNIDIEIGAEGNDGSSLKIYCASLTNNWSLITSFDDIDKFYQNLLTDETLQSNNLKLSLLPSSKDISLYENFLSKLSCNAGFLRLKILQNFLNMPSSVKEGLAYAKHKEFGNKILESNLLRHPRYIRQQPKKKFIRLTKDDRGYSLITYLNNNENEPLSALKLSKQSELKILKEIDNGFLLKAGKRQWVLQCNNNNEFNQWFNELENVINTLGGKVDKSGLNTSAKKTNSLSNKSNNNNVGYNNNNDLATENERLKKEIENWKKKYNDLLSNKGGANEEIKMDIGDDNMDGLDDDGIRKKLVKEFTKEKDDLIRDFEIQKEDLRSLIEDLRKQLENKVASENGRNGLKGLVGTGYKEEELKSEIDTEKKQLESLTDEEKAQIKFIHRHWHRHAHKHIHHHRHVHIHDDTKKPPQSFTNTHTVSHTITHTNTQFQIKKASFF